MRTPNQNSNLWDLLEYHQLGDFSPEEYEWLEEHPALAVEIFREAIRRRDEFKIPKFDLLKQGKRFSVEVGGVKKEDMIKTLTGRELESDRSWGLSWFEEPAVTIEETKQTVEFVCARLWDLFGFTKQQPFSKLVSPVLIKDWNRRNLAKAGYAIEICKPADAVHFRIQHPNQPLKGETFNFVSSPLPPTSLDNREKSHHPRIFEICHLISKKPELDDVGVTMVCKWHPACRVVYRLVRVSSSAK